MGGVSKGERYSFKNTFSVGKDIPIPKAQNSVSPGSKPLCSYRIVNDAIIRAVLAPIQLDDQFRGCTEEVGDIRAHGLLTAKAEPAELFMAKPCP